MHARALPILMYHHVSPLPGLVTISPDNFRAQMDWLARNGYHTASCADLEAFLGGKPLPSRTVMVTFDDGYLDNYVHAYPTLRRNGQHAVLFAVTDWIGDGPCRAVAGEANAPPLLNHRDCQNRIRNSAADEAIVRWSEIERMGAGNTFEIHSHTASHTRWDKTCPDAAEKTASIASDLLRSARTLEHRLGDASRHLCWPQGYFDDDYVRAATEAGFTHLHTTRPGTTRPLTDPRYLPRIVIKDKGATWFASRIRLYSSPLLASLYSHLKGN